MLVVPPELSLPDNVVVGRIGGGTCCPIGPYHALTAAHVSATPGSSDVDILGTNHPVIGYVQHPDYNGTPGNNFDIAIITVSRMFPKFFRISRFPVTPNGQTIWMGGRGFSYGSDDGTAVTWSANRGDAWGENEFIAPSNWATQFYLSTNFGNIPTRATGVTHDSGSAMYDPISDVLLAVAISGSNINPTPFSGTTTGFINIYRDEVYNWWVPLVDTGGGGSTNKWNLHNHKISGNKL